MIGSLPYDFPGRVRTNPKRRPPQETTVVPWKDLRAVADRYEARETGFSWNENADDTVANGAEPTKFTGPDDYRWEGVFWMWERRFIGNTGGPCQKWNMRREWRSRPAAKRELYYREVARRSPLGPRGLDRDRPLQGLSIGEVGCSIPTERLLKSVRSVYSRADPLSVRGPLFKGE